MGRRRARGGGGAFAAPTFPLLLVRLARTRAYGFWSGPRLIADAARLTRLSRDPLRAARADRGPATERQPGGGRPRSGGGLPPARGAALRPGGQSRASRAGPPGARQRIRALPRPAWRSPRPWPILRRSRPAWRAIRMPHAGRRARSAGRRCSTSRTRGSGPTSPAAAAVQSVRLLLEHGADPDSGYLWHGLVPPFTALTGLFGGGELGSTNQPPHPHAEPLARVLLEAGADPNDGQTLYNRMFSPDNAHLDLLLAYGLGVGEPASGPLGTSTRPAGRRADGAAHRAAPVGRRPRPGGPDPAARAPRGRSRGADDGLDRSSGRCRRSWPGGPADQESRGCWPSSAHPRTSPTPTPRWPRPCWTATRPPSRH